MDLLLYAGISLMLLSVLIIIYVVFKDAFLGEYISHGEMHILASIMSYIIGAILCLIFCNLQDQRTWTITIKW